MQSRSLLQLLLAWSGLFLSKAEDGLGPGSSCIGTSSADDGRTRVTFLREDAAGVRTLSLSQWSEDARLLTCEVSTDPLVTETYRVLCDKSGARDEETLQRFNLSALLAPDAPCAHVSTGAPKLTGRVRRDGTERKARRKRAWMFPGTMWCGTGSRAARYEQLGMFESADRCCREHDHCVHNIPALTMNYGVFNSKFFTVSHCDCDQRFRQCLLTVNDSISHMVGYSFFNIIQVPCFELKEHKRCRPGRCNGTNGGLHAVFRSSLHYNRTDATSSKSASGEAGSPDVKQSEQRCSSDHPPKGSSHRKTKKNGCKRHRRPSTTAAAPTASHTAPSAAGPGKENKINKTRGGKKKSGRKELMEKPTQTSPAAPQGGAHPAATRATTTTAATKMPSTMRTTTTQTPTTTTTQTPTTSRKGHRSSTRKGACCGIRTPVRGDTFQPLCKNCAAQNRTTATPLITARMATPSTTTRAATPSLVATVATWTPSAPIRSQINRTTLRENSTRTPEAGAQTSVRGSEEPAVASGAPRAKAERGLRLNAVLRNMTENLLLCQSLKHLDRCRYRIPPLATKYDLQNTEAKTAFHCDCSSRAAAQIEGLSRRGVLPALLEELVSPYCFKLPKEPRCSSGKSCSGGFTKASDLLQALKKTQEKDHKSDNDRKRGIPVRLFKRCLRLQRRADIVAQLT